MYPGEGIGAGEGFDPCVSDLIFYQPREMQWACGMHWLLLPVWARQIEHGQIHAGTMC